MTAKRGFEVGLCAACRHACILLSDRGSEFWLCQLGLADPALPKYPALPVLLCTGFVALDGPADRISEVEQGRGGGG